MRDLFFKLFKDSHFDTGISITAFSVSHIVYLVLIIGAIVGLYFLYRNEPYEKKRRLVSLIAILVLVSYISDFFMHEFANATETDGVFTGGGLNLDKLPFHICTLLCPLSFLVQFNKRLSKFIEPVVILAVLAPMMYLFYPANVGDGEPWCYTAVQTMFFHGALMAWGILNLALGIVKPEIKKCWHSAVLLAAITVWAKLGCLLYDHNWFFLNEDAFYIGLVEKGIIPQWLLMIINPVVFFLAALAVYGVVYAIRHFTEKKNVVSSAEKELETVCL